MKRTPLLVVSFLLLCFVLNQSFAQQKETAGTSSNGSPEMQDAAVAPRPNSSRAEPGIANASLASTEVVELRAQLSVVRDYQDRFVGVVLWSLGAVVTMTIGLLAFGWFTNKSSHDRDRDAIRQERENLRNELRTFVIAEVRQASQDITAALGEREKEIEKRVDGSLSGRLQRITSRLDDVAGKLHDIEHENVERDATSAAKEKRYGWAIYQYCKLLDSSVRRGSDSYEVPDILDAIRGILTTPGVKTSADDVTELATALNKLPNRYHAAADKLIELAKELQ